MKTLHETIRDAVKSYSDAAKEKGKSQGFGDGYNASTGWLQGALEDAIWRLSPEARAIVLTNLAEDTIRNLNAATLETV